MIPKANSNSPTPKADFGALDDNANEVQRELLPKDLVDEIDENPSIKEMALICDMVKYHSKALRDEGYFFTSLATSTAELIVISSHAKVNDSAFDAETTPIIEKMNVDRARDDEVTAGVGGNDIE